METDDEANAIDIAEVFSPPRLAPAASKAGLQGGWSMDLSTGWDLSDREQQAKAMNMLDETKPGLLIASPPCTYFGTLMRGNLKKMKQDEIHEGMTKAITHVNFAASMCQERAKSGRLFLFEHPARATSWKLDSLCELLEVDGVTSVLGDMCSHGMTQSGGSLRKQFAL